MLTLDREVPDALLISSRVVPGAMTINNKEVPAIPLGPPQTIYTKNSYVVVCLRQPQSIVSHGGLISLPSSAMYEKLSHPFVPAPLAKSISDLDVPPPPSSENNSTKATPPAAAVLFRSNDTVTVSKGFTTPIPMLAFLMT